VSAYLTRDQILAARATIDPAFLDSPVMRHAGLDEALGCAMILKVETINPIRSFKGRGTEAVLESLAPRPAGVVAASTGNFGQGIAWSARRRGISATICVPANANPSKVDAMRRLGATVIVAVPETDEADAARSMAGESNLVFIEDGAFPEIAAGAGSIAQELTAAGVTPDIMLVQIGDGALIGGIGSWLKVEVGGPLCRAPGQHDRGRHGCASAHPVLARAGAGRGGRHYCGQRGRHDRGDAAAHRAGRPAGRAFRRGRCRRCHGARGPVPGSPRRGSHHRQQPRPAAAAADRGLSLSADA
jgi:hypothetical protein